MTLVSTNAVIVQGGSGGGDTIWADNIHDMTVAAGDKVLANRSDTNTIADSTSTQTSSSYSYSCMIPLPNNDFIRYNTYYKWNPETETWTTSTVSYDTNRPTNTPFIQGSVVQLYCRCYDASLAENGSLGDFAAYFFKTGTGYFSNNYAIKASPSNSSSYYVYPWSGLYSSESISTSEGYYLFNTYTVRNFQWLNVIGDKIFICVADKTFIVDVSNFPNCTKTTITHTSSNGVAVGCTGDDDGDYDIRWLQQSSSDQSGTLLVKKKVDGTWVDDSLSFIDFQTKNAPTYNSNSKILSLIKIDDNTLHLYRFNTTSKEFSEIVLPEDIRNLNDGDFSTSKVIRPLVAESNGLKIGYTSYSVSTGNKKIFHRILLGSQEERWNLVNNTSSNYYPNASVTGKATGNVNDAGQIEISTVL